VISLRLGQGISIVLFPSEDHSPPEEAADGYLQASAVFFVLIGILTGNDLDFGNPV
jgi:hypothetical protein